MENEILEKLSKNIESVISNSKDAKEIAAKAALVADETKTGLGNLADSIKVISESKAEQAEKMAEMQKGFNDLAAEVKAARETNFASAKAAPTFADEFAKIVTENHKDIMNVNKSKSVVTDIKAGANMTTSGDLTGNPVISFLPKPALVPAQKVNFRDLVSSFQSNTPTINLFTENYPSPAVGGFGQQLTEGTLKEQVEYKFTNNTFTASYINGFVRFSKQMAYNLPWLQTYLPQMLLRDFYKKENAVFYAALIAAATGSTTALGGNTAEKLIQLIANIEGTDFGVNGITVPPALWAALMLTTVPTVGTSYGVPGGVTITPAGQMLIAGIPIIKATWQGSGTALVGDWTTLAIAQVENLKVEFFEQDDDNVQRNLITARVECLEVLVIEQPRAFAYKTGLS